MFQTIIDILRENSLAQGGLVVAGFSALILSSKQLFRHVTNYSKRFCTSYIRLYRDQQPLHWLLSWLSETEYGRNSRHLTVRDDDGNLTVGSGVHFFFRKGRLVFVNYTKEYMESDGHAFGIKEEVSIRVIPGKRSVIEEILKEAKVKYEQKYANQIEVYVPDWNSWRHTGYVNKRPLSSLCLTNQNQLLISSAIERFSNNRKICQELGIPWRLGLLLTGPPGNGKTSLSLALASMMNKNLYILSLNGISSDKDLLNLCARISNDAIVLIEDIDAYNIERDNEKDKGITLSGLLNAVDGVMSKQGVITIVTTNCPDKLDDALTRKGRLDVHMELSDPTEEQLVKMFSLFGREYQGQKFENMAAAQYYLLNEDPDLERLVS